MCLQNIEETLQKQESAKQRRIMVKSQVEEFDGQLNEIRKRLQAHNKDVSHLTKQVSALENKLEQKRGDRHSLLKACKVLTGDGHMVNVTLCFSANQALLAAKAGATFISPFIGRLDDINLDGLELIEDIRTIYDNYGFETQILAASIRSANHMKEAALIGADVATAPPAVIKSMANHVLTDKGLDAFMKDWAKTGQNIL